MRCIQKRHSQMLNTMVSEFGVDINFVDPFMNVTPLEFAFDMGNYEALDLFINSRIKSRLRHKNEELFPVYSVQQLVQIFSKYRKRVVDSQREAAGENLEFYGELQDKERFFEFYYALTKLILTADAESKEDEPSNVLLSVLNTEEVKEMKIEAENMNPNQLKKLPVKERMKIHQQRKDNEERKAAFDKRMTNKDLRNNIIKHNNYIVLKQALEMVGDEVGIRQYQEMVVQSISLRCKETTEELLGFKDRFESAFSSEQAFRSLFSQGIFSLGGRAAFSPDNDTSEYEKLFDVIQGSYDRKKLLLEIVGASQELKKREV